MQHYIAVPGRQVRKPSLQFSPATFADVLCNAPYICTFNQGRKLEFQQGVPSPPSSPVIVAVVRNANIGSAAKSLRKSDTGGWGSSR